MAKIRLVSPSPYYETNPIFDTRAAGTESPCASAKKKKIDLLIPSTDSSINATDTPNRWGVG
jgi:hypothetical protein